MDCGSSAAFDYIPCTLLARFKTAIKCRHKASREYGRLHISNTGAPRRAYPVTEVLVVALSPAVQQKLASDERALRKQFCWRWSMLNGSSKSCCNGAECHPIAVEEVSSNVCAGGEGGSGCIETAHHLQRSGAANGASRSDWAASRSLTTERPYAELHNLLSIR